MAVQSYLIYYCTNDRNSKIPLLNAAPGLLARGLSMDGCTLSALCWLHEPKALVLDMQSGARASRVR